MVTRTNRKAGRAARASGEDTEAAFEASCAWYARRKAAAVVKMPTPARVLGPVRAGRFLACWAGTAPVDYLGTLAGGRAVAVEVKASGTTCLPLEAHGAPRLGPEQAARLASLHDLGALAVVLVCVSAAAGDARPQRWFALRWPAWVAAVAEAEASGRKSLGLGCLETHGRECALDRGWPDWLAALGV